MENDTITTMAKADWIQIRTDGEVKAAIRKAAHKNGRDLGPWLLFLAAVADEDVAKAMGIETKGLAGYIFHHPRLGE